MRKRITALFKKPAHVWIALFVGVVLLVMLARACSGDG